MATPLTELSNALADAVEAAARNVVAVHEGGRSGVSGTLWRDNLVVTAAHTISGIKTVTITLPEGGNSTAEVLGVLPRIDLAVLKLSKPFTGAVQAADSAAFRVGEIVLAVGRRAAEGVVATHGIISGFAAGGQTKNDTWLRLDLQPFTGFSGGPLVNAAGRVIGINTSGRRRDVVTIPAASIERAVSTLLAKGRMPVPFVGLGLQPVHLSAGAEAATHRALLVVMVEPAGPAQQAGLLVGDIVTTLDGESLKRASDLERVLDPERVGQRVRLGVIRGGKQQEVAITIGDREAR